MWDSFILTGMPDAFLLYNMVPMLILLGIIIAILTVVLLCRRRRPILTAEHAVALEIREGLSANPTLARSRSGQALSMGALRWNIRFRIGEQGEDIWVTTDKDPGKIEGERGTLTYQGGWLVKFMPE